jgi:hypothetical protein
MDTEPTNGNATSELTEEQIVIVGRFNDFSFENPGLTFEEVVLKEFGCSSIEDLFPPTPWGRLFEKECREVFEMERRE